MSRMESKAKAETILKARQLVKVTKQLDCNLSIYFYFHLLLFFVCFVFVFYPTKKNKRKHTPVS